MAIGNVHGLTAYRDGCRCQRCKDANALQKRKQRARSVPARTKTKTVLQLAPAPPPSEPAEPGNAVARVREELALYSDQVAQKPSISAMALALAEAIDDPACLAARATNVRALDGLLEKIRPEKRIRKSRGRLASVQALLGPQPDTRKVVAR